MVDSAVLSSGLESSAYSVELVSIKSRIEYRAIGILAGADFLALFLALVLTNWLLGPPTNFTRILLLVASVSFGLGLTQLGLYPGRGKLGPTRIRARALMAAVAFISPAIVAMILPSSDLGNCALECLFVGVLMFGFSSFLELVAIHGADALGIWRTRATFFGDPDLFARLKQDLAIYPELGLDLTMAGDRDNAICVTALVEDVETGRPTGFVALAGAPLPSYYPVMGHNKIGARRHGVSEDVVRTLKRAIDIVASAVGIVFIAPALLTACLFIYLADGRPIFFRQVRIGQNGRRFRVWKLRSMYRDAGLRLETLLANDPVARAEWEVHFKLRDDPRILPGIGKFIRRSSVDEIPQLWNILIGDMSFIGPRPFPEDHLEMFSREFRRLRQSVPPGLSGLWQVTLRSNSELSDQERLDRAYIREWSFWLDIYILFRTPIALLMTTGAR